jgi:hypothetical protein
MQAEMPALPGNALPGNALPSIRIPINKRRKIGQDLERKSWPGF